MKRMCRKAFAVACAAALAVSCLGTMKGVVLAAETHESVSVGTNVYGAELPDNYYDRKVVGYFPNYAINLEAHKYFDITQLQWDKLTHVQYAFAIADSTTFELVPSDPVNDVESKFEGREFYHKGQKIEMDDSLGYYGQFNLMHTMKEMYPDVTVLVSTGGWAASQSLWLVTDNEQNMNKFADSAVEFIRKYGFDGIDIDFEYPSETSQSGNPDDFTISEPRRAGIGDRYTQFIKIMAEKLAEASKEDGRYYWLTSAVTASSWVLGGQNNTEFLDYLDFVSVMSYDYHGGWNNYVENQANIYADPADKETAAMALPTLGFDWSKNYYRGAVQSEKILMGVPYYTRGWTNVQGGDKGLHGTSGTPATGEENLWHDLAKNGDEVAAGANPLWHVLNLMQKDSNYKKYWDPVGCVPHIWNETNGTFLSFEDEQSIQERINVVEENNLGGVLIWVMHGDYDYDEEAQEYTVGDTLTTMLYDRLTAMDPADITSDIDLDAEVADFDVDFTGKYDHPNYYYTITVTNNTGAPIQAFELSFDLPKSAVFQSAYGGNAPVIEESDDPAFNTVTISAPAWQVLNDGESMELQGAIKLNFAGVKNFKLNGMAMKSEVEEEITRLQRLGVDIADLEDKEDVEIPVDPEDPNEPIDPEEPVDPEEPEEPEEPDQPSTLEDTYDDGKVYYQGDVVVYKGQTYVCKWWTQGSAPGEQQWGPWELTEGVEPDEPDEPDVPVVPDEPDEPDVPVVPDEPDEPDVPVVPDEPDVPVTPEEPDEPDTPDEPGMAGDTYDSTAVYVKGDVVVYNGQTYVCKWWTQGSVPGEEQWGPWELAE